MSIIQNIAGMGDMTEQVIATDLLLSSKTAIKSYAAAIAETATPEVRNILHGQLNVAIQAHDKITNYMIKKGYYNAYNQQEQIKIDLKAADTAIGLEQR